MNKKSKVRILKTNIITQEAQSEKERIWVIDIARFYGIALIYYGHFIERIISLGNFSVFTHYKFIYSFHMVLFFILAGYVTKENDLQLSFRKYFKHRFMTRLLPFIFFNLLLIVPTFFLSTKYIGLGLPSIHGYLEGMLWTLYGFVPFNPPTWFLLCLFTVEIVHYYAFKILKSDSMILFGAVIFYSIGYIINWKFMLFNPLLQGDVNWNYFYLHEALILYSFYLLGIYFRHKKFLIGNASRIKLLTGLVITLLITLFTFNLNNGPFRLVNAVIIRYSEHGNFLLFPLTAIAGSAFLLLLSKVTPYQKAIATIGKNTLILLGLNGLFYNYINPSIVELAMNNLPNNSMIFFGVGFILTLLSLIICYPLIYLFNRYIPQLVGKPQFIGPIFKNII